MKGNKKKVSKVLLSSTLLLTMFFTTMPTSVFAVENAVSPKAEEKGIDIYKNFPDANFIKHIEDTPPLTVGGPKINIDKDGNKFLSQDEINATTKIYIFGDKGIKDLTGIGCFTNLTHLACTSNQLTNLDVSGNVNLKELSCNDNQLTSLDLSNNTKLTHLSCQKNLLQNLIISSNTLLQQLECYNNQLTSLDVSKNTALTLLYCQENQLTSLDVSNNPALKWLNFSNQNSAILYDKNKGYRLQVYDKGFDNSKASNFVGATNSEGTLTGVVFDKPITYDYSTGYAGSGAKPMTVTLTFKATDATKLEDAKTLAEEAITGISATNETTNNIILDAVTKSISSVKGVSAAWKAGSPTITLATKDTAGSITGTIILTCGSKTMEVTVDKLIGKLPTATPDKPTISAGNNGANHQVNTSNDMTFTCSGRLEDLNGVYVDGKLVAESNYTLKSGSTILTLKSSYLDTLSVGKHILKFQYKDNVAAETDFTITTKTDDTTVKPSTPNTGDTTVKPSTPNTGDTSNTMLCFGLMILSGCLAGYSLKKKKALRS